MLFILGQFFRETGKRFLQSPLKISLLKADFIDNIREMGILSKKERTVYKHLEDLQKDRYISYDEKSLKITRKGYEEYVRIQTEIVRLSQISGAIRPEKIKFKRKMQTKLVQLALA